MPLNPYQSPLSSQSPEPAADLRRVQALHAVRIIFLILLAPALYNYWQFDQHAVVGSIKPNLSRTVNLVAFAVGSVAIWCVGLSFLEGVAALIRRSLAPSVAPSPWNAQFYQAASSAIYLAIPGAFLWGVWVFAFYQLEVDFFLISYVVGIPAHLLGACFYLPLFYRWYRLAQTTDVP